MAVEFRNRAWFKGRRGQQRRRTATKVGKVGGGGGAEDEEAEEDDATVLGRTMEWLRSLRRPGGGRDGGWD